MNKNFLQVDDAVPIQFVYDIPPQEKSNNAELSSSNNSLSLWVFSKIRLYYGRILILFAFVSLLWIIQAINAWVYNIAAYGVIPRTKIGLIGIVSSAFLHANWGHLIANTTPTLIMGGIMMLRPDGLFVWSTLTTFLILFTDFLVWILGNSNSDYIGFSGVVYGYFGFLMTSFIFERPCSPFPLLLTLITGCLYSGIMYGIFPHSGSHSAWDAHLIGVLNGIMFAAVYCTWIIHHFPLLTGYKSTLHDTVIVQSNYDDMYNEDVEWVGQLDTKDSVTQNNVQVKKSTNNTNSKEQISSFLNGLHTDTSGNFEYHNPSIIKSYIAQEEYDELEQNLDKL